MESTNKSSRQEITTEKIESLAGDFILKESQRVPDSNKGKSLLLMTFFAMALAMVSIKAEGQVHIGGLPPIPTAGITGEIINQGRNAVIGAIENKKMVESQKIGNKYDARIVEIGKSKEQLENLFRNGKISVADFEIAKQKLDNEIVRVSRERNVKTAHPLGVRGSILEGVIRGY